MIGKRYTPFFDGTNIYRYRHEFGIKFPRSRRLVLILDQALARCSALGPMNGTGGPKVDRRTTSGPFLAVHACVHAHQMVNGPAFHIIEK